MFRDLCGGSSKRLGDAEMHVMVFSMSHVFDAGIGSSYRFRENPGERGEVDTRRLADSRR